MRRPLLLVTLLLFSVPTTAWAQEQTGSVSGTVTDADGEPLPGVTITIDGSLIRPTTTTSRTNGTWRFPAIPPASDYVVIFELGGFTTLRREQLVVELARGTRIHADLTVAAVVETVLVTAASPVVDPADSGLSTNFTEDYLQGIPTARDPWELLRHAPGIQLSKENVGGVNAGSASAFTVNGSRPEDNTYIYDGADVSNMTNPGASSMYYDFDAFEEVSIDRAGNDASVPTAGVRLNLVTRRGGNTWQGSGRFYLSDKALHSYTVGDPETGELTGEYTEDELWPGYLGDSIDRITDWGFEAGGPLIRDRLFAWGAYGTQDIRTFASTQPDNTQLYNWHGKANWHAGDDLVANFSFLSATKTKQGRGAGPGRPDPTTQNQDGTTNSYTAKLQYTIGNDHFLEATFNYLPSFFALEPRGGRAEQPLFDWADFSWDRSYYWFRRDEPTTSGRVDGNSYLLGGHAIDHELKYGYTVRVAEIESSSGVGGGVVAANYFGEPAEAWLIQASNVHERKLWHGGYVSDTITGGRWVANLGLRYDYRESEALPSFAPAHPTAPELFPAVMFPGYDPGYAWSSLSPRIGLTYDISGSGRTIARLSVGRYYSQGEPAVWRASTTQQHEIDFEWFDLNHNTYVDAGETGGIVWVSPGWDPEDPNGPTPNIITDTDPPITDELLVGLEHELARELAVSASATFRRNHREVWTVREGADEPDAWIPITQDVRGWGELDLYAPAQRFGGALVHGQRPDYTERYAGLEFVLTKRMSRRWMANASFSWGLNRRYYDGPYSYTDPTNVALEDGNPTGAGNGAGGAWGSSSWNLKTSGLYQLPAGFTMSGFLQVRNGLINPKLVISNPRPNGGGRAWVLVEEYGASRLPVYWDLDLRAEKSFDVGARTRIHLILDAFNLTNNDIVLERDNRQNSINVGRALKVMPGRTIRLGMRLVLR